MAVAGLPFWAHLSRTVTQAHSRPAAASVTFEPLDVKGAIVAARSSPDAELSTRRRILAATFVVLARDGRRKLQLSDVAAEAKVSRPCPKPDEAGAPDHARAHRPHHFRRRERGRGLGGRPYRYVPLYYSQPHSRSVSRRTAPDRGPRDVSTAHETRRGRLACQPGGDLFRDQPLFEMQEMAYAVEDFDVGAWPYVEYGASKLYENGQRTRRVVDVAEGTQCRRGHLAGVLPNKPRYVHTNGFTCGGAYLNLIGCRASTCVGVRHGSDGVLHSPHAGIAAQHRPGPPLPRPSADPARMDGLRRPALITRREPSRKRSDTTFSRWASVNPTVCKR
jgi:hypothetical protein